MKILKNLFFLLVFVCLNCLGASEEQPANFGWLIEGKICGMARPTKPEHLKWLEKNNIGLIVTLTIEGNLPDTFFEDTKLERLYLPIEGGHTATFEQVDSFISQATKTVDSGKAVAIHCMGGKGRLGTMFVCWLIVKESMTPEEAIEFVRNQRPEAIEGKKQADFIFSYFEHMVSQFVEFFPQV